MTPILKTSNHGEPRYPTSKERSAQKAIALILLSFFWSGVQVAHGQLDCLFGDQGIALSGLGSQPFMEASMTLQEDGKILLVGHADSPSEYTGQHYVARLDGTGAFDSSFGNGGLAFTGIFGSDQAQPAVAVQPDGKILVAGRSDQNDEHIGQDFVARFLENGALDSTFGEEGVSYTGLWGSPFMRLSLEVDANHRILLGGGDEQVGSFVARFRSDGSLDPSFGQGGIAHTSLMGSSNVAVALQGDGKILVGSIDGLLRKNYVARFSDNGALDPSFGQGGIAYTGIDGNDFDGVDIAIHSDGKILMACSNPWRNQNYVVRFLESGAVDRSFGDLGFAYTPLIRQSDVNVSVVVLDDDRILVGGLDAAANEHYVVRFEAGGFVDTPFGEGGFVRTGFFGVGGPGLAVQSDGRILLAGIESFTLQSFVARFSFREASWTNYGEGWPGANGIPSLSASSNPIFGEILTLDIGNSRGATTDGYLLIGLSEASTSTNLDGTLLLAPSLMVFLPLIWAQGISLSDVVPRDPFLDGISLYLQVLERDPGASRGVSFSQGLRLDFGCR